MPSYLIIGCARGLSLAMAEHLATFPSSEVDHVFATARGESTALKAWIQSSAGKVEFIRMDSSKEISIKAAVAEVDRILEGQGLDVLVNNAGQSFTLNSTNTLYAPAFCKTLGHI
jgi:NAD(P)-dependent dehydrogenase (short-subunit alcohol dehydrogenase family)